jgi:hypothetical protein
MSNEEEVRSAQLCDERHKNLDRSLGALDMHQAELTRRTQDFIIVSTEATGKINVMISEMRTAHDKLAKVVDTHHTGHWKWIGLMVGAFTLLSIMIALFTKYIH